MILFLVILLLIVLSMGLAYKSILDDKKKGHVEEVKKRLEKGRVIYYRND